MSKFYTCYVLYMFMYHFIFSPFRIGLESGLHIVYIYIIICNLYTCTNRAPTSHQVQWFQSKVCLACSKWQCGLQAFQVFHVVHKHLPRSLTWAEHCPRGVNGIEITRDIEENVDLTVRLVFVTLGYCLLKIRTMIDFVFDKTRIQNINIYMYSYHLPMTIMGLVYHWE